MSGVPAKQIDGDVAVGRNVTTGGNATIRGNVKVGHNLKVEGYLEAPNIKDTNKGMFSTEEDLQSAYPEPEDGWWAMVGSSLPADIYQAKDGIWIPTGGQGSVTIDLASIERQLDEIRDSTALLTPIEIESEEVMEQMISSGETIEGQIYFTKEQ